MALDSPHTLFPEAKEEPTAIWIQTKKALMYQVDSFTAFELIFYTKLSPTAITAQEDNPLDYLHYKGHKILLTLFFQFN